jgi:hypothetical protein
MAGDEIPFGSAGELEVTKVNINTAAREQYARRRIRADCLTKEEVALFWYPRTGDIIDRAGDQTKKTVMTFGCESTTLS